MSASALPATDGVTISCYLNEIPACIESELADTYETLHSSLQFFRVWRSTADASCYVARDARGATDIFVFRREGGHLLVLNEMIDIAPASLARFATYVFEQFPAIEAIHFNAVNTDTAGIGFPVQRYNAKDTYMVSLPDTPEAYLAALGKSTRANLRSRLNNIQKHFPTFTTKVLVNEAIDAETVGRILRLSELRIHAKGVGLRHDDERTLALAKRCGFVMLLLIDGRLCAGSINYRIGASVFGEVTAHDPAYERHGLGALCVYHTICASIRTGARKFYLGGGLFGFKERMLGKRLDMDELHIYRSRGRLLANLDVAAAAFAHGQVRRLKLRLHERKGTWLADRAYRLFHLYKNKTGG